MHPPRCDGADCILQLMLQGFDAAFDRALDTFDKIHITVKEIFQSGVAGQRTGKAVKRLEPKTETTCRGRWKRILCFLLRRYKGVRYVLSFASRLYLQFHYLGPRYVSEICNGYTNVVPPSLVIRSKM